jgi:hypothetical protein
MNFAVLNHNNIVENIIVADSKEVVETIFNTLCIEYTDENPAIVGWTYEQETGKFTPPAVLEEPIEEVEND